MGSFFENGFEATLSSKMNVLRVWKGHFSFFPKLLGGEVETVFWESKTEPSRPFEFKVGDSRRFLENGFEANLISKTNVLSVWKGYFSVFCKFLSDKIETLFWECEAKHQKLFKVKFGHRKLLRKWFWKDLELKNECSERLKREFFSFLQIIGWRRWNHFLGKWSKTSKTV